MGSKWGKRVEWGRRFEERWGAWRFIEERGGWSGGEVLVLKMWVLVLRG